MSAAGTAPPIPTSAIGSGELFRPRLAYRRMIGFWFSAMCLVISLLAILILAALLTHVFRLGWSAITPGFFTNVEDTLEPERSGIYVAIFGTIWLIVVTAIVSIPAGVGAAVYLEEYAPRNRLISLVQLNIANLAGVPSIVYGILGLALFVRWMQCGRSVIAGALTLSLLVLPTIIIAAREAISAVPKTIREAAYAVGATRWQTVRHHVLPAAIPGIMTGVILALSRAIGETAPLIVLGGVAYINAVPGGDSPKSFAGFFGWAKDALLSKFTAIPIQIYDWSKAAQTEYQSLAAGAIIVLLAILLTLNALAAGLRAWHQNKRIS